MLSLLVGCVCFTGFSKLIFKVCALCCLWLLKSLFCYFIARLRTGQRFCFNSWKKSISSLCRSAPCGRLHLECSARPFPALRYSSLPACFGPEGGSRGGRGSRGSRGFLPPSLGLRDTNRHSLNCCRHLVYFERFLVFYVVLRVFARLLVAFMKGQIVEFPSFSIFADFAPQSLLCSGMLFPFFIKALDILIIVYFKFI